MSETGSTGRTLLRVLGFLLAAIPSVTAGGFGGCQAGAAAGRPFGAAILVASVAGAVGAVAGLWFAAWLPGQIFRNKKDEGNTP